MATSVLVLTFRETIGNIRTTALARSKALRQDLLDREARALADELASGRQSKPRQYILFLRPFSADREIRARDPNSPEGYDVAALETRIAFGFASLFVTISFSSRTCGRDVWGDTYANMPLDITPYHPKFSEYAGRLFYSRPGEITASDENWFDTFRMLSQHATLIVSVPIDVSLSPEESATILELLELSRSGLLQRCVFVMPPEQSVLLMRPTDETEGSRGTGRRWSPREFKLSVLWESSRAKLSKGGIELPAFRDTKDGATLFVLNGGCRIESVSARELNVPSRYLRSLGLEAGGPTR